MHLYNYCTCTVQACKVSDSISNVRRMIEPHAEHLDIMVVQVLQQVSRGHINTVLCSNQYNMWYCMYSKQICQFGKIDKVDYLVVKNNANNLL